MLWWLLLILICGIFYKFLIQPLFYWKKRGVAHKTPIPIFGDLLPMFFRKVSFYDIGNKLYKDFPNLRYNGSLHTTIPVLIIRDPELIKRIYVKDFEHFTDHGDTGNKDIDVLLSKTLFQLNGQEWKEMRATLSPAFTGSKMKAMFVLISDCAQQLVNHYINNDERITELDIKDLFTRYANDVIATCAFGVKCDSLEERNNTFFEMGKEATTFSAFRSLKLMLAIFCPKLYKILRIPLLPSNLTNFFVNIIQETISYRVEHNIIRPDIIHLLLEARKGKLHHEDSVDDRIDSSFAVIEESAIGKEQLHNKEISDMDIAAQAFIFFLAGFDTASTILSFMSTELAINPDVQEKLFSEIEEVMAQCSGNPNYEAITQMKYMDMVVSETLRKWSPAPMSERKCTKPYKIEAVTPGENDLDLEIDDSIMIPILGIHRDEKYYPNPERFDPDRFSEENKHNIVPFTYLPFGVGPRACIGSRFALLEIKVLCVYFLWKFEFIPIAKTVVPITISTKSIIIQPEGGFWLGLKRR